MRLKFLIPFLALFTLLTGMSQTVKYIMHSHDKEQLSKELKKESEEEKEEKTEEKEKELNELISLKLSTLFQALSCEMQASEKRSFELMRNYKEPLHCIITPPPRASIV